MAAADPAAEPPGVADAIRTAGERAGPALRALLTCSDLGLAVWDTGLRCVWANDVVGRYDGIPRERRLGRPPHQALAGDAAGLEAVMREVLATGHCAVGREYRVPPGPGERAPRVLTASFLRLGDTDGRPLGVCLLVLDVRNGRGVGDRLAVISEAGARIGTTLDVMRTAQELADFSVPLLADYVTVDLTEAVRLGGEPLELLGSADGRVPTFRRAGVASVLDGTPESLWATGEGVYVPEASPFMQVLRSGRPLLQPRLDTSPGSWLDSDPARAEKIEQYGMHSLLVVPVRARGLLMGVAVFVRAGNPAPFDDGDRLLAEELVSRAALSLDNARRYTRERTAALTLQRSLLPRRVDGGDALEVAARYLPADAEYSAGGDWFDVFGLPGGRTALVVGDVVGHGIAAAAAMGRLRTAIRTLADLDFSPADLLASLDRTSVHLSADNDASETERCTIGATCVYAVYDPAARTCAVALAGHPPPVVAHPDGHVAFPELPPGTPLGYGVLPYESTVLDLPAGGLIALYSDGLVEDRRQDIDVGMERVREALARGRTTPSLDDLCTEVVETLPTPTPRDDVTLLLARTH
ncbi:SpoIIE family protein phosphatase [Streptomyces sp. NPDC052492]|uniref:SpoIIE family protein phosphatase n=1 Tax=Streptomyces sp. NPDC052492 TaxID=3365691 RepID=UPI0037D773C7